MYKITLLISLLLLNAFAGFNAVAKNIEVSSQEEFNKAQSSAQEKDVILWLPGIYSDIYLDIFKDNITVKAKVLGKTIFTGGSKALIRGDKVTLKGIQFIGGDVGSNDVVKLAGDYITISEVNISRYKSYKYLYMKRDCQYNTVYKCNFENRLNVVDKNILSIGVSDKQAGYHKVQYCSFKNIDGTGRDMGVEPIRVGSSSRAQFDSKTIVEYCYFTKCNGDGELISNKSSKNIIRYNTFEDNPLAEVVLRHGSDTYVYGNFFLRGKGGVRIREGQNHYIFNNYFSELKMRSVTLNSSENDPIKNVYIMHNTFVKTSKLHLGGDKKEVPKKVALVNNLFAFPTAKSLRDPTGKESWVGNMYKGNLGISVKKGLKKINPLLTENQFGLFEIEKNSPAVNNAQKNKIKLPIVKGVDADYKLSLDILKNKRPQSYSQKDVGCMEFKAFGAKVLKRYATVLNSGPSYNTMVEVPKKEVLLKEKEYNDVEYEEEILEKK